MKKQNNDQAQAKRKSNTERKHAAIRKRFTELHDTNRMRLDDSVNKLCDEFFMSPLSIERIIGIGYDSNKRGKSREI